MKTQINLTTSFLDLERFGSRDDLLDLLEGDGIELMCYESCEYFAHGDPKDLLPWMKYMQHVHGKFFYVDENGEESAVRVPEIVSVLKEGGFSDYISAEYEGHHWFSAEPAQEQLKRYMALVKKSYFEA